MRLTTVPAMTRRHRQILWWIIGFGFAARTAIAFTTVGIVFDTDAFRAVGLAVNHDVLHVYSIVNNKTGLPGGLDLYRWPYPPGLFPWAAATVSLSKLGVPFHGLLHLAPIAADAVIAWLVQDVLGRRGFSDRARLTGASLVALGPTFVLVSGYQGQVDSVAILPGLAALRVWGTSAARHRAVKAGLLIGIGACVKTVPVLTLFALLPSIRGAREGIVLVAAAIAVPLVAIMPFLAADPSSVVHALRYVGGPGLAGITLIVQPKLAISFITERPMALSHAAYWLYRHAGEILLVVLFALEVLLLRFRPRAVQAAVVVWLCAYAFNVNFAFQYAVWGLPFFLVAGHFRAAFIMQVGLVAPGLILYLRPWHHGAVAIAYLVIMQGVWLAWLAAIVISGRQIVRARSPNDSRWIAFG